MDTPCRRSGRPGTDPRQCRQRADAAEAPYTAAMIRPLLLCVALLPAACATTADRSLPPSPCSEHCQTHTEGYEWAQRGNLSDAGACEGYADAFVRGCRNGVEDLQQLRPASQGI